MKNLAAETTGLCPVVSLSRDVNRDGPRESLGSFVFLGGTEIAVFPQFTQKNRARYLGPQSRTSVLSRLRRAQRFQPAVGVLAAFVAEQFPKGLWSSVQTSVVP